MKFMVKKATIESKLRATYQAKGNKRLAQKQVTKVTLHFVWGQNKTKKTSGPLEL